VRNLRAHIRRINRMLTVRKLPVAVTVAKEIGYALCEIARRAAIAGANSFTSRRDLVRRFMTRGSSQQSRTMPFNACYQRSPGTRMRVASYVRGD
jgi:hypothetical protein